MELAAGWQYLIDKHHGGEESQAVKRQLKCFAAVFRRRSVLSLLESGIKTFAAIITARNMRAYLTRYGAFARV